MPTSSPRQRLLMLIGLAGIVLRFVALNRSYWFDELATLVNVDVPDLATVLHNTAGDKQPPLYNISLFYWTKLFGLSEIGSRSLSLLFAGLTLATPWLARRALGFGEKVLCFSLLCALSLPIRYAQEARNYALLLLMSASCLFLYYEALKARGGRLDAWFFGALALLAGAHLFGLLLALSFLGVIFLDSRGIGRRIAVAAYAAALAAAVVVPLLLGGAAQAAGGKFWITFSAATLGLQLVTVFTPVGLALLGGALWRRLRPADPALFKAVLPFVVMLLGAVCVSFNTPIITDRNLIGLLPPFALVLSRWLLPESGEAAWAVVGGVGLLALQSAVLLFFGWLFVREDFRAIARYSVQHDTPVCYVVPEGGQVTWRSTMAFYTVRLAGRADLEPRAYSLADITRDPSAASCTLWAEGHPEGRVSALRHLPALSRCTEIPLGPPHARITSALLQCPR